MASVFHVQIVRWLDGGFGMVSHNYDGDMLTDEIAQIHRSPGFITSNLIGKSASGSMIKEFEASHGKCRSCVPFRITTVWEALVSPCSPSFFLLSAFLNSIVAISHYEVLSRTDPFNVCWGWF
jgi:hypothetical protein